VESNLVQQPEANGEIQEIESETILRAKSLQDREETKIKKLVQTLISC